ncbi:UvrB/UvrC motif-containing protein [Candidatus Protochlamydia sp. R18]|uniref:UvrB/UvrC motif-containing protein n=1 Tax=Candidatus Protochlamydia sp. R18 TaxID=1353977 RepID=UPI0005A8593C|nr:UvrB/UvrC motif-containing protein [Candidatus Protochlamydia sp. R18]
MVDKNPDKNFSDRPLECGECKKPIAVRYTEIVGENMTHTSMCASCPELERRLHGTSPKEYIQSQVGLGAALECGNCGTTLEEVKRGHQLGCPECYNVFGNILLAEIQAANRLTSRLVSIKKSSPIHIGRAPGETLVIKPSSRLLALDEALKETLQREDYEQAALLRDQIRALTEHKEDLKPEKEGEERGESK